MSYYIRILSPSEHRVPFAELAAALTKTAPAATLECTSGTQGNWDELTLTHQNGTEITVVERNLVSAGSIASEELKEFIAEVADCKPKSAAAWLTDYFSKVRTIYAFQLLSGTECESGWDIVAALKNSIWQQTNGIFQADGEGFSNEDGFHILWQFSESVAGDWQMGILQNGAWVHFQMDLANRTQRQAFSNGEVPLGVTLHDNFRANHSLLKSDQGMATNPKKIHIVEGDLLDQKVEVIVNAWNRNIIPWWLLLPQGVSGAIKRRAGYQPFRELGKLGAIPLGGAVLTGAGKLGFKAIIHVAGINMFWRATRHSIKQSVISAMQIVHANAYESVAFPVIGAGTGGFGVDGALNIMLEAFAEIEIEVPVFIVKFK